MERQKKMRRSEKYRFSRASAENLPVSIKYEMKTTAWMAADALRRLIQYHVGLSDWITRAENFAVIKYQSNKILTSSGEHSASWEIACRQNVTMWLMILFYEIIAGESCYCYHLPSGIWNLSEEAVRKVWAGRELVSAPSLFIPPCHNP